MHSKYNLNGNLPSCLTGVFNDSQWLVYIYLIPDWLITKKDFEPSVIVFHRWDLKGEYCETWHKHIESLAVNFHDEVFQELKCEEHDFEEKKISVLLFKDEVDCINYFFDKKNNELRIMPRDISFFHDTGNSFIDF